MNIPIISSIIDGVASSYNANRKAKVKINKAKLELRLAEIKARTDIKQVQLQGMNGYDIAAQNQRRYSILDEYLGILVGIPLIICFVNAVALMFGWTDKNVMVGISEGLTTLPFEFWVSFWGVQVSVFGLSNFGDKILRIIVSLKGGSILSKITPPKEGK